MFFSISTLLPKVSKKEVKFMIILGAVDGTSELQDDPYEIEFANSHVKKLANMEGHRWSKAFYHRGPYVMGTETAAYAELVYKDLVGKWKAGEAKAIFLAGYSRGGAAAIEIAMWLKQRENIPVECLILFDAVDRTNTLGSIWNNTPIASTVKQVIYAQRDVWGTLSRLSFGNCGLTTENPAVPVIPRKFFATHGGMGGVPWKTATNPYTEEVRDTIWEYPEVTPTKVTPAMDAVGSEVVWKYVWELVKNAWQNCMAELEKPPFSLPSIPSLPNPNPSKPFLPMPNPNPLKPQRIHTVVPGDWLSKVAITYYKDMNKWKVIYEANKSVIGSNPDLIKPGMRLVIP